MLLLTMFLFLGLAMGSSVSASTYEKHPGKFTEPFSSAKPSFTTKLSRVLTTVPINSKNKKNCKWKNLLRWTYYEYDKMSPTFVLSRLSLQKVESSTTLKLLGTIENISMYIY